MKINIHPDVEKFFLINYDFICVLSSYPFIVGYVNDKHSIIGTYDSNGNKSYYLNDKKWGEDDFLKIIKLKAFM